MHLYVFLCVYNSVTIYSSPSPFIVASSELENVIKSDELALSLKHIKAKKRHRGTETLLAVDFDHENHNRFAILLDRHHKRGS